MLHQLPLRRMEKDGPFLPGIFKSAFQLFDVVHHPVAALGVRMFERMDAYGRGLNDRRPPAGRQFQQGLAKS